MYLEFLIKGCCLGGTNIPILESQMEERMEDSSRFRDISPNTVIRDCRTLPGYNSSFFFTQVAAITGFRRAEDLLDAGFVSLPIA